VYICRPLDAFGYFSLTSNVNLEEEQLQAVLDGAKYRMSRQQSLLRQQYVSKMQQTAHETKSKSAVCQDSQLPWINLRQNAPKKTNDYASS